MTKINIEELLKEMVKTTSNVLKDKWPDVRTYAEMEFQKLGETIIHIQKMKNAGEITEERARLHIDIQKHAMRTVMLTVEGLGIIAVEEAINAALNVVRDTVNTAIGWRLL